MRRLLLLSSVVVVLLATAAGAGSQAPTSSASARAWAIRVVGPAGSSGSREIAAPPDASYYAGGFSYAGALSTGALTASVSSGADVASAGASAAAEVSGLSLFGGEVTVGQVSVRVSASASSGSGKGEVGVSVSGVTVGGAAVSLAPGSSAALGDWGTATVVGGGGSASGDGWSGSATGLQISVNAEHNGLPAGTVIQVGYVEASSRARKVVAPKAPPPPPPAATASPAAPIAPPGGQNAQERIPPLVLKPPPGIVPKLTRGGYVFPVYGPASFSNTFGAARATVGWHHGEDIFAPLGAPVLAVADGTLFSVGWNDIGGNRLWLRDRRGNEFYYAHLSAFSPLAVNGRAVRAGDVVGFVGTSGDAQGTPPHLHFEIHPASMLPLGYDRSSIAPYAILMSWRRVQDLRLVSGASWIPSIARISAAPPPGAYLLSASDISTRSGLTPGSLREALARPPRDEAADGAQALRQAPAGAP